MLVEIKQISGLQSNLDSKLTASIVENGILLNSGTIGLGGTLSYNTNIELDSNNLVISNNASNLLEVKQNSVLNVNSPTNDQHTLNVSGTASSSGSYPDTSTDGILSLQGDNTTSALRFGIVSGSGSWIQSGTKNSTTTQYIRINPSGGRILMGASSDLTNAAVQIDAENLSSNHLRGLYVLAEAISGGIDIQNTYSGGGATVSKGLNIAHSGNSTSQNYGAHITSNGTDDTNVGVYISATGATNNYALIADNGRVGIGETEPSAKLHITGEGNTSSTTSLRIDNTSEDLWTFLDDSEVHYKSNRFISLSRINSSYLSLGTNVMDNFDPSAFTGGGAVGMGFNVFTNHTNTAGSIIGFGTNVFSDATNARLIGFGRSVFDDVTTGTQNFGFGMSVGTSLETGTGNLAIGHEIRYTNLTNATQTIAFNSSATPLTIDESNKIYMGAGRNYSKVRWGGDTTQIINDWTIQYQNVSEGNSNRSGRDVIHELMIGTGTGIGGNFIIKGAPASSSGDFQNTLVDLLTVSPNGSSFLENTILGIGTNTPNSGAILDLVSTDKALLLPRLSDPSSNVSTPINGMIAYDSTDDELQAYINNEWQALGTSGGGGGGASLTIANDSTQYLDITNDELSIKALAITNVTTNSSSGSNFQDWYDNFFTPTNSESGPIEEGDVLILTSIDSNTEVWMHNGGTVGLSSDFTRIQNSNPSDLYTRSLFDASNGLTYDSLTGLTKIGGSLIENTTITLDNNDFIFNSSQGEALRINDVGTIDTLTGIQQGGNNLIRYSAGSKLSVGNSSNSQTNSTGSEIVIGTGSLTNHNGPSNLIVIGDTSMTSFNGASVRPNIVIGNASATSLIDGANNNLLIGHATGNNIAGNDRLLIIGNSSGNTVTSNDSLIIGNNSGNTLGGRVVVIGNSTGSNTGVNTSVLIGNVSSVSASVNDTIAIGDSHNAAHSSCVLFGSNVTSTAIGQIVYGSTQHAFTSMYLGSGALKSTGSVGNFLISNTDLDTVTNGASGNLTIQTGTSTGNADGGDLIFRTASGGISGTTQNSHSTRFTINQNIDVTTTEGALIVSRLSDPSSLTSPINGMIAYDSTDDELQAYINGSWEILGSTSGVVSTPTKYSETLSSITADVANTITHSLNDTDILIQCWDETTGEAIYPKVDNRTSTAVDVTFVGSAPSGNVRVVVKI